MSNSFIASTKGFDQLYEKNPSVVLENRLYPIDDESKGNEVIVASLFKTLIIMIGLEVKLQEVQVNLMYSPTKSVSTVEVKGCWDNWEWSTPLTKLKDNVWDCILFLSPGIYQYKFVVDGCWTHDDKKPKTNEMGNENNVLTVTGDYTIYPNIMSIRRLLNSMHQKISIKYPELYLYQPTDDILTINRENISKTKSRVLISRSAFKLGVSDIVDTTIYLPGAIKRFDIICHMEVD